jgi:hypothetical protein
MTKNEEFNENIFKNLSPDDDFSFWSMATDFVLHQIETELDEVYSNTPDSFVEECRKAIHRIECRCNQNTLHQWIA